MSAPSTSWATKPPSPPISPAIRASNATVESEFEFSNDITDYGREGLAIARLYRVYRDQAANTQAAGCYLGRLLLTSVPVPELLAPAEVAPGCAVHLRNAGGIRVVAVDIAAGKVGAWPILVAPDCALAHRLRGLRPGDVVTLTEGFGEQTYDVVSIESLFVLALHKAQAQVTAAAVPSGPLWCVRVVKENGEVDMEVLLRAAQQRKRLVGRAFRQYQEAHFPLAVLAKMVGIDPVTLVLGWTKQDARLFVGIGTHAAASLLRAGGHRYVLDLLTLAELAQRQGLEAAARLLGRPSCRGWRGSACCCSW